MSTVGRAGFQTRVCQSRSLTLYLVASRAGITVHQRNGSERKRKGEKEISKYARPSPNSQEPWFKGTRPAAPSARHPPPTVWVPHDLPEERVKYTAPRPPGRRALPCTLSDPCFNQWPLTCLQAQPLPTRFGLFSQSERNRPSTGPRPGASRSPARDRPPPPPHAARLSRTPAGSRFPPEVSRTETGLGSQPVQAPHLTVTKKPGRSGSPKVTKLVTAPCF